MKVFTGGIITETNTFSPIPTGLEDFYIGRLQDQDNTGSTIPFECSILQHLEKTASESGWEFCSSFIAVAEPGGITTCEAYETLREQLLSELRKALPVDMVLLPLHGAMVANGYEDCEGDIISKVREITGDNIPIGIELDLHCHLTDLMIEKADLIAIYREYPHTDILERAGDLFRMTVSKALGKTNPVMALYDCRMIHVYPTAYAPMRSMINQQKKEEQEPGIISVDIGHGFPWGDVQDCGTKVLVTTDGNYELAKSKAREIGQLFFQNRHKVQMTSLSMETAFDQAQSLPRSNKPIVIADQSDNSGGGAASDSTFALEAMLERKITRAAMGMIWDPMVVSTAMKVDIGTHLKVRLGGKTSPDSGHPLDLDVIVKAKQKEMHQPFPQDNEESIPCLCGDTVCLEHKGIYIVVNSTRTQVFHPEVFTQLGLKLSELDILVVKSMFHFYAGFAPVASNILLMGSPGSLNTQFTEIPYTRVNTHKYPWLEDPFATEE